MYSIIFTCVTLLKFAIHPSKSTQNYACIIVVHDLGNLL